MAVTLSKTDEEIRDLPLVELAWEILKAKKEPYYFRDLMSEIQTLRGMTEEQAMDVIARLYTEMNIDGRFLCIGQNVWGLKRWYPVDKVADKTVTKRFVRRSSDDEFSDDDDLDSDFDELDSSDDEEDETFLEAEDDAEEAEEGAVSDEEEEDVESIDSEDEEIVDDDAEFEETSLDEEESDDEEEDDNY